MQLLSSSLEVVEIQFCHNCISYLDLGVYQLASLLPCNLSAPGTNTLSCHMICHTLPMIMLMSWCLFMNSMYHFILGLLLSPNFFWMFNLLSNSSTLSRMSNLVYPYPILAMCMIHFSILASISSESFIGGPFFHPIGIFPFSLSHIVNFGMP